MTPEEAKNRLVGINNKDTKKVLAGWRKKIKWYVNNYYSTAKLEYLYTTGYGNALIMAAITILRQEGWNVVVDNNVVSVLLTQPLTKEKREAHNF